MFVSHLRPALPGAGAPGARVVDLRYDRLVKAWALEKELG
jgi:hypothetical protein